MTEPIDDLTGSVHIGRPDPPSPVQIPCPDPPFRSRMTAVVLAAGVPGQMSLPIGERRSIVRSTCHIYEEVSCLPMMIDPRAPTSAL